MAAPRRIVVDDTDPAIQYSPGGWTVADASKLNTLGNYGPLYNSTSHSTSTSGSTLSFSFNGTSISVMGTIDITTDTTTNTTDPTWSCFVDEIPITNPNPTFAFPENNWPLCDLAQVAPGSHVLTIQVQSKGQPFYLDNILYTPLPGTNLASAVLEYTNTDPSVSFGSGWQEWGTQNVTQTKGAQVALNFHGTSVSLLGYIPTELPHNASSASYTIDGGAPVDFALTGLPAQSATLYNALFFQTNTLTPATHNLVVTYAGNSAQTPLVVGMFYVTNISTPSSSSPSPSIASPSADLSHTQVKVNKTSPLGAIVGGIVGCLAVLALVVGLVFWCRRRQRRITEQTRRTSADPFTSMTATTADSRLPASVSTMGGAAQGYPYSAVPANSPYSPGSSAAQLYADVPAAGPSYPYTSPGARFPPSPTDATSSSGGGVSHARDPSGSYVGSTHNPHDVGHAPNLSGSFSGGSTSARDPHEGQYAQNQNLSSYSGSAQGSAHDLPLRSSGVGGAYAYPTPTPSETSRKYQREREATAAFTTPLTPLRAGRGVVVRQYQDSGVRLRSESSLGMEPEIVELPPGYSPD
ncbi:hypothetical protein B0H11DRAFT_2090356 [Mycena galericulata]|nr:hypothetical protein B0H11DRAFT_2090356 [Mycena galericulata]